MGVMHKHALIGPGSGEQVLHLYTESTVQHFDIDHSGDLCLWVHVPNDSAGTEARTFSVRATGEAFDGVPLRTVVVGGYVWHLVEHTETVLSGSQWWNVVGEVVVRPAGDGKEWEVVRSDTLRPIVDENGVPHRGRRADMVRAFSP